jgi:hypothetical protein
MSSLTKAQFITQIKTRSALLAEFTDATLSTFIDMALRAFSDKKPEIRVSADNAYTESLVDLPDDCLDVYSVYDGSGQSVTWSIENDGSGDKLRLGIVALPSYQDEIEQAFYVNPLISGSVSSQSFTSYNIKYSILQTMATIKDTSLEAIYNHILYQACSYKAEGIAVSAGSQDVATRITDSAGGVTTDITFASSKETLSNYTSLAESYLAKFNTIVGSAFGVRS